MRLRGIIGLCCLSTCVFVLCGCASVSPQKIAARKIQAALPQVLGPAESYRVTVDGDAGQLSRGRAKRVHVDGVNVQLSSAVTLDTLTLDAQDISFNRSEKRLEHVGQTQFAGTISQPHLDFYMNQQPNPFALHVQLRQRDVVVTLPITAGPLQTSVAVAGQFIPNASDPSALNFTTNRAQLGILPVPAFAVNAALDEIGPVVRLSGFQVPIALETITIQNGVLHVSGTARLDSLSQ